MQLQGNNKRRPLEQCNKQYAMLANNILMCGNANAGTITNAVQSIKRLLHNNVQRLPYM